jgi:integrase/recombinase XerC
MSMPNPNLDVLASGLQVLLATAGASLDDIRAYIATAEVDAPDVSLHPVLSGSSGRGNVAEDLARANAEYELKLQLPADILSCPRLDDPDLSRRRLVVRPGYGDVELRTVTQFDVKIMKKWVKANALANAAAQNRRRVEAGKPPLLRDGRGAEENFVAAVRCLYTAAADNGLVPKGCSPAATVAKPKRNTKLTRRPMSDSELQDVWVTWSAAGRDPELWALVYRLMMQTATRRIGCINLRLAHLIPHRQSLKLRQKGNKFAEFPVSADLLADLDAFATSRGSTKPEDPVLRQKGRCRRTGTVNPPLTDRCFDRAAERVQEMHEWAKVGGWGPHWLRHHVAALAEEHGGSPCKMAILDHEPNGQSQIYGRANFEQLAWVVAQMTGSPHPLAQRPPWIAG